MHQKKNVEERESDENRKKNKIENRKIEKIRKKIFLFSRCIGGVNRK